VKGYDMGSCAKCRFWQEGEEVGHGECRANPPSAVIRGEVASWVIAFWPPTSAEEWCGKYAESEPVKDDTDNDLD
jgi:hypothetical protein